MKFSKATVRLNQIEQENEFYRFSDRSFDQQALEESIDTYGVLNPIVVIDRGKRFQVVSGFRRLEIAFKLALIDIPVYVVSVGTSKEDLFRFLISENQATRSLNLWEKSSLLAKLMEAEVDEDKIISLFMPLMHLPPSRQRMKEMLVLLELPESLREYLISKNLSLRRIRHLKGLSKETLAFFNEVIELLAPSANLFQEITKQLVEVSRRDDKKVEEIAFNYGLIKTAKDQSMTRSERLRKLRDKVFSLRYPVLASENQRRKEKLEALKIGSQIDVKWDRSLETKGIEIRINLHSEEDLENSLKCLEHLRSSKMLKEYT